MGDRVGVAGPGLGLGVGAAPLLLLGCLGGEGDFGFGNGCCCLLCCGYGFGALRICWDLLKGKFEAVLLLGGCAVEAGADVGKVDCVGEGALQSSCVSNGKLYGVGGL